MNNEVHIYRVMSQSADNSNIQFTEYPEHRNITVTYAEGTHFGAETRTVSLNQLLNSFSTAAKGTK